MKGIKLLMLAVGCALLVACTKTDDTETQPVPIGFVPTMASQTRGTDLTNDNLANFGVFAYFTQGGSFNSAADTGSTPNFMCNQKVAKPTGSWTYNPMKYWPANTADKLSFFAYAPYVDEMAIESSNLTLPKNTDSGYPIFIYTVPAAEANQIDLLASIPLMNRIYSNDDDNTHVNFTLKHTLTKVKFVIKSQMEAHVTALSVNNASKKATLTFTDSGFGWGNSYTGTQIFTATLANGGIGVVADAADAQTLATFYLLPHKSSATFSITYLQDGETVAENVTNAAFPSSPASWDLGANVTYQFNIKNDGLSISTISIGKDWNDGGEETVDSTD